MDDSVKTVEGNEVSLIDDFFAGVAKLRTYLDHQLQDPLHRRSRLGNVAFGLLKPRDARDLSCWLIRELADAIGASAAAIFVRGVSSVSFEPWHVVGVPPGGGPLPSYEDITRHSDNASKSTLVDTLWVPLKGIEGNIGALWFVLRVSLDDKSKQLLSAIADTAAVALEQSSLLQAMR
ncbi:MAG: hypothetical protein JW841_18660 [Deltaproteobacteria bacterium]|nr:hypothetical protein [Deltaproteobacteria bacterium]